MAPSPENDNTPKAPDKNDKAKLETTITAPTAGAQDPENTASGPENKDASVSRLNDIELKALLDEAINYKIPKDRVGTSKLFQNLLEKAEEDDRKARATSASGSESVRYYNTTATHRTRRRREANSVSENLTHGGSLNNLAKEELYAATNHLHRPPKTVSARQRQGGSLPCNVNAGVTPSYDKQFFEEARKKKETKIEYTAIDMESESLLEHDSLSQNYNEQSDSEVLPPRIPRIPMKYTSRINLEIGGNPASSSNVDDSLTVSALERASIEKSIENEITHKPVETSTATARYQPQYSLLMPTPLWSYKKAVDDKKVDENGNALNQNNSDLKKNKKKKTQTDKNVVVLAAKDVAGHRSDIINDLDKLVEYIGGNEEQTGAKSKGLKSGKFHKHHFAAGDDKTSKKQRTRSKVKAESRHKSNSMEEISISKLDDFHFTPDCDLSKVPLRSTKSNADRPRERRSWGNSESLTLHASAENLETSDFRVVTKKKKSKKRRNSVSGRRQPYSQDTQDNEFNRVPSPELRRKSACSAPHSDKSNDSSDEDSDSLPIDPIHPDANLNLPISYADIAKNSSFDKERPKWNRPPSERRNNQNKEKIPLAILEPLECSKTEPEKVTPKTKPNQTILTSPKLQINLPLDKTTEAKPIESIPVTKTSPPPDVQNIQNWPTIQNHNNINNNRNITTLVTNKNNQNVSQKPVQNRPSPPNNNIKNLKNTQPQNKAGSFVNRSNTVPNNIHMEAAVQLLQNTEQVCLNNMQMLPHNIPDVQTIEKMHFKQLQQAMSPGFVSHNPQEAIPNHMNTHMPGGYVPAFMNPMTNIPPQEAHSRTVNEVDTSVVPGSENCDSDRTSSRPAVVILSGECKEVSGLTFGFDINEQLLSDDVCENFTSRFFVPNVFQNHNHDKIVNFIGLAWEDIVCEGNGKVKYFSENL